MSINTMVAPSAREKGKADSSFGAAFSTQQAIQKYGLDKVVDVTLGVVKDENGKFATLPTVEEIYRSLPGNELCDYAAIEGIPEFREAAIKFALQGHQPEGTFVNAVATPGGSGAIHHVIYNYVEKDEVYLIPDWCWGPYREIGVECGKKYEHYKMFNNENKLDVDGLIKQSKDLLEKQDGLMTIFNTPAHNPSGYTITNDEWKNITDFYREAASDKSKRIVVLWDMAYVDYAGDKDDVRSFLKNFDNMPENVLLLAAFSMSKSFLIYGMRSGALIGISSSEKVIQEFFNTNTYSNRATWSNGSRGAQKLLATIVADPKLKEKTDKERQEYSELIAQRARIFVEEAKEIGLPILPYEAGFFITLPAKNHEDLVNKLKEDLIFSIPMDSGGVRFAMSAAPTKQIPGLATLVKKHFTKEYQL